MRSKNNILNKTILFFAIIGLVFSPQIVAAYDVDFYSSNDILFYNPDDDSGCYSPSNTTIADGENIEIVLRFLVEQKGLSLEGAAGITGNLMQESGYNINPKAEGPLLDNGTRPYGIAQWAKGRRIKIYNWAKDNNVPVDDIMTQLEFLWYELQESDYKDLLESYYSGAITPEDAAIGFLKEFERSGEKPGDGGYENRKKYAAEAYNLAVSLGLVSTTTTGSSLNKCGDSANQDGWDLEGDNAMTFYDQSSTEWKDKPFGIGTIGECGSGPTSLASIIATLTKDETVNPENVADYYASHGGQESGGGCGSTWNWNVIESEYKVNVEDIGLNLDKAKETIKAGGLVLFAWEGAPFNKGGHILIMRKIGAEGTIYVANTGGSINRQQSDIAWDENIFIKGYSGDDIPERGVTGSLSGMWSMTKR